MIKNCTWNGDMVGEAPATVALSKEERAKINAAVQRRGLSLQKSVNGLTRAEREARSRERQRFYADRRVVKAEVRP